MKNIIPHLISLLIIYFVFSFVEWEFNPQLWEQYRRIVFILISVFVSIFISVKGYFIEDKNN